jgi:enoyl-CoA hydratase/carnithine racemase
MSRHDDYSKRYRNIAFERREGVVCARLHTDGAALQWGSNQGSVHGQLSDAFRDLARDPELRVLILTGTGTVFCTELNHAENPASLNSTEWSRLVREGRDLLQDFLALEVPVIAAVNGPVHIHSELPVLADIVLAAETAEFADRVHFVHGVVPGDGVHVVWPLLLGVNRARYFLMTGQAISAREALTLGVVAEVIADADLQARAWRLGAELARKPLVALRNTRMALTRRLRREMNDDLDVGLALEGLGLLSLGDKPS